MTLNNKCKINNSLKNIKFNNNHNYNNKNNKKIQLLLNFLSKFKYKIQKQ